MVISDPNVDAEAIVVVSLTTWDRDKDQSCILMPGYHSFIHHKTCVSYRDAKIISARFYQRNLELGLIIPSDPASDDMVDEIIRGAGATRFIPLGCREILARQDLI